MFKTLENFKNYVASLIHWCERLIWLIGPIGPNLFVISVLMSDSVYFIESR